MIRLGRVYRVVIRPGRVITARVIGLTRAKRTVRWWVKDTTTGRVWVVGPAQIREVEHV